MAQEYEIYVDNPSFLGSYFVNVIHLITGVGGDSSR